MSPRFRRAAALALLLPAAASFGGCLGTGEPKADALDQALSAQQQRQLVRVMRHQLSLGSNEPAQARKWGKTLVGECRHLDASAPVLDSLAATCGPLADAIQLLTVVTDRCRGKTPGPCERTLQRIGGSLDELSERVPDFNAAVIEEVHDSRCVEELVVADAYAIYTDAAARFRAAGQAVGDADGERAARELDVAVDRLSTAFGDERSPDPADELRTLRERCDLEGV